MAQLVARQSHDLEVAGSSPAPATYPPFIHRGLDNLFYMKPRPRTSGEKGYSSAEVCREAGLTLRILDYWARTGVLRPSVKPARGSGSKRRYSLIDLRVACILNVLRQLGARRDVLGAVAVAAPAEQLDSGQLYVSPLGEVTKDETIARRSWACLWCVNLDPVAASLDLLEASA